MANVIKENVSSDDDYDVLDSNGYSSKSTKNVVKTSMQQMKEQLGSVQSAMEDLRLGLLGGELNSANSEREKIKSAMDGLLDKLKEGEITIRCMDKTLKDYKAELDSQGNCIMETGQQFEKALEQAQNASMAIQMQLQQLKDQRKTCEEEKTALKKQVDVLKIELSGAGNLKEQIDRLSKISDHAEVEKILRQQIEELQSKLHGAESREMALLVQQQDLIAQIGIKEEEGAVMRNRLDDLQCRLKMTEDREKFLHEIENDWAEKLAAVEEAKKQLEDQNENLQSSLKNAQDNVAASSIQMEEFKEKIQIIEEKLHYMSKEVKDATTTTISLFNEFTTRLDAAQQQINELEKDNCNLTSTLKGAQNFGSELSIEFVTLEEKLMTSEFSEKKLKKEIEELKWKIDETQDKNEALLMQLSNCEEVEKEFMKLNEDLLFKMKESEDREIELSEAVEELKENLANMENTFVSTTNDNQSSPVGDALGVVNQLNSAEMQSFSLQEMQLGDELFAAGNIEEGAEHIANAIVVCEQGNQWLHFALVSTSADVDTRALEHSHGQAVNCQGANRIPLPTGCQYA